MGLIKYIGEVRGEMKHVSWPTRKQTIFFTILIIIVSLLIAFFLGFFDFIFNKALGLII